MRFSFAVNSACRIMERWVACDWRPFQMLRLGRQFVWFGRTSFTEFSILWDMELHLLTFPYMFTIHERHGQHSLGCFLTMIPSRWAWRLRVWSIPWAKSSPMTWPSSPTSMSMTGPYRMALNAWFASNVLEYSRRTSSGRRAPWEHLRNIEM